MMIICVATLVFAAGCVGGLLNAYFSGHQELTFPKIERMDGMRVFRPGWVGNMIVGGIAGLALWGLYGPLAEFKIVDDGSKDEHIHIFLSLSQLFASLITGIGGSRILSSEAEKIPSLKSTQEDLGRAVADLARRKKEDER